MIDVHIVDAQGRRVGGGPRIMSIVVKDGGHCFWDRRWGIVDPGHLLVGPLDGDIWVLIVVSCPYRDIGGCNDATPDGVGGDVATYGNNGCEPVGEFG